MRKWAKRAGMLALALGASLLLLIVILAISSEPVAFDATAPGAISITNVVELVPGPGLPPQLPVQRANNNVDIAQFDGRCFLAFRTAPTHFASANTRLIIVSSTDRKNWEYETVIHMQSDLREPRLLVFRDKLFFYFFQAGSHPLRFDPQKMFAMERRGKSDWTPPRPIYKPGYVPWRAKTRGDLAYMSVYYGKGLYDTAGREGEVRLLKSTDGYDWKPISEEPQLTEAGAEEPEFEFDEDGNLVILIRCEQEGGSILCTAAKDDLAHWKLAPSPFKYDSALMFRHHKTLYILARRNVAGPSRRDIPWLPQQLRRAWNLVRYSMTRKRTALYRVDLDAQCLRPLFDLPGRGDTAFPAITKMNDNAYYVVNYTNAPDGIDWPWLFGQLNPTRLYACELAFGAPGPR